MFQILPRTFTSETLLRSLLHETVTENMKRVNSSSEDNLLPNSTLD